MKCLANELSKTPLRRLPAKIIHTTLIWGSRWPPCAPSNKDYRYRIQARNFSKKYARPRTALFFPGQGVQKVGMLKPWLAAFPSTAGPLVEEIDHLMEYKLSKVIEEGPNSLLTATVNAQPAIMACSVLILRILEIEFGFKTVERVDVALGHSLGEFAALVAAGNVHFEDSLYLIRKRAAVMAECSQRARADHGGEYGMIALVTEPGHLTSLIEAIHEFLGHHSTGSKSESAEDVPPIQQVLIGNINSKNQIVLSGNIERIKTLLTHVRQFGGHDPRAVRLNSDCPFHSSLMIPAKISMKKMLEGKSRVKGREDKAIVTFPGVMDCISNVSARPFESKENLKDLWARSCVETVRWWDSIKYLDQEQGVRRWIGIGPGKVGRNLVGKEVGMRGRDVVKGGGVWAITDPKECEEVLKALDETEMSADDV
ncbi:BgTH12-07625 [Blumeria graminis f. sp. triticale]|uniref:[acyl-carrier-protein] S-malonyltransferase n=3 Tax=Blumeria graminis TaxID=34373 RepID=A0A061HRC3_BLUGR|nr:malonyl CoA-acyl carrier protein transacylase [Blumeria graminis f. sp. tritici 96224]CAD6500448.1 BgTH12-07625 [Blumeria graminis f. sp. triticale]VCU40716.1 Bgt-5279 [Blumeria graminis f. sp. tritici]